MSPRLFLNSRPHPSLPLRLFVVLMAMLQFVAPTWHVCEMGGHALSMATGAMAGGSMAAHGGMTQEAKADSDAPQKALICYCPAKPSHDEKTDGPRVTATVSHADHVTCLALLLQTMPGALATPAALFQLSAPVEFHWEVSRETSPSIAFLGRFRGRAPPLDC